MEKFSGYEEARVNGDYEKLKLGGHICKIIEVKIEKYNNKDGKPFEQLVLKIDIAEPDEQAGFYQRKFAQDAQTDALKAKWKGNYRITIPQNDSEDYVKSNFKTLTTSVEKSNPGYVWNWEENTLVGKVFGGVFGLEEFTRDDGSIIAFTRCRFIRSTEKILEIGIPKVKLADKSSMDYDEYIEKKKQNQTNSNNTTSKETSVFEGDSDDLPF